MRTDPEKTFCKHFFFGIVLRSFYDRCVFFLFHRFVSLPFTLRQALYCVVGGVVIALSPAFGVYCAVHRNVNKFLEMCTSHQYENTHMQSSVLTASISHVEKSERTNSLAFLAWRVRLYVWCM